MVSLRLAAVLLAAFALAACDGPAPDASGREVYVQTCARCHGSDLGGGIGPALGEESNASTLDPEVVGAIIADGRGRMPSFRQTLSEEQIDRVVGYLLEQQGRS